ncbi:hypothetical protein PQX77_010236 [Marasmius sp. AFHP31]|nr:hypothetical protein PQX77_010236 [Marasmius sp. AFHP31]
MASQFFHRATNTTFGHNTILQHVEGDVSHNYFNYTSSREGEKGRIMPKQNEYREFLKGDICLREQTWSEETELVIRIPSRDNCLYQRDMEKRVKVIKKFHTATVFPHSDQKFTVVTFEPKDKRDKETIHLLWKAGYEAYSSYKSPRLIQMLVVLVTHEQKLIRIYTELVNGLELYNRYYRDSVVHHYLNYTHNFAIERLRADKTLPIRISIAAEHWSLEPRTRTWQYDTSTSQPLRGYLSDTITSLRLRVPNPELDAKEIIACFEQTFSDCLYLHALSGGWWGYPSSYMKNSLLTFGTVVNDSEGRTLAHLSPPPSPEWSFEDYSHGMKVSYSTQGPPRADWSLNKAHNTQLFLSFSLWFPLHERIRLRTGYLCQSHLIPANNASVHPYLIDCVEFSLIGDFLYDPTTGPTPAYLFVPRFWVNIISGMFCTHFPPLESLFYWASDPNGINKISKQDWDRFGIPTLQVQLRIGSYWDDPDYDFVRDYLRKKGYGEDGARYARDHGYPELILGDPHDGSRIEELSKRLDKFNISPPQPHDQFFPPSTSLFNTPFDPQASDIPPSQTVWNTKGVSNMRKRREMEHLSGRDPAKRVRVARPQSPARLSQRAAAYPSSARPRSFGGTTFARVVQQPESGGLDRHGSFRIREWEHRHFEFEAPKGWDGTGHTTGNGGNDGRSCGYQSSFGSLG